MSDLSNHTADEAKQDNNGANILASVVLGGVGCVMGLIIGVALIALLALGGFTMLFAAPPPDIMERAMNGFMFTAVVLLIVPPLVLGGLAYGLTWLFTKLIK